MNILSAYIEVTNLCNLNCTTCYNASGLNLTRTELPLAAVDRFVDQLQRDGCCRIIFSGGEPSLYSEYAGLLRLPQKYPELSFGICSNGILCSDEELHLYQTNAKFDIQISMDGSCDRIVQRTRGPGVFMQAARTVRRLTEANPVKKVVVKSVLSQNNIEDIKAFYLWAISEGAIPEFAFALKMGNSHRNWKAQSLSDRQKFEVLRTLDVLQKEYGIQIRMPLPTMCCPYAEDDPEVSILVKPNGMIFPCQSAYHDRFALLHISDYSLERFKETVGKFVSITQKRKKEDYGCARCAIHTICKRGCPAIAMCIHDDPLASDEECVYRKLYFWGYNMHIK